jgi:sugar/nucleoside kinase (ribokinase family)
VAAALLSASGDRRAIDVVGLGEISLDRVIVVDELPLAGGKAPAQSETARAGGQVATAVLGARVLGLRTRLIAVVGDDDAARASLAPLAAAGVELAHVLEIPGVPSRTATILVESRSGERQVFGRRDPRLRMASERPQRAVISDARLLMVDASDPEASLWAARVARDASVPVLLDADERWSGEADLFECVDFPVVAGRLAEEWGDGSVSRGLRDLARFGGRMVVATLGQRGSLALDTRAQGREIATRAFEVDVVDTTGAGDAFRAGFAYGLLAGADAQTTLELANAAAGLNCEGPGAQGGLCGESQLHARLAGWRRAAAAREDQSHE